MASSYAVLLLALSLFKPVTAFWCLPCISPLVVERADPIISPGIPSGHVHTIMGGNAFSFTTTYASSQTSTCSSCTVIGDFSNYWNPALYYQHPNGSFTSVPQSGGATIYYLQRPGPNETTNLTAFPAGLRMVAGDPLKRNATTDFAGQAISYACLNYNAPPTPETAGFPTTNCPDGLRAQVFFPSCWDGVNLDSPDHASHMAYPATAYNDGPCPESHPVHFISLFYEVVWNVDAFSGMWYDGENAQPFVWAQGDPTGYGLHGDFLNGWDVELLQSAVDECNDDSGDVEDCGVFELRSDAVAGGCSVVSEVEERVEGWMERLPGCNVVQWGPGEAVPVLGCGGGSGNGSANGSSASGAAVDSGSSSTSAAMSSAASSTMASPSLLSRSTASPSSSSSLTGTPLSSSTTPATSADAASGTPTTPTISVTEIHSVTLTSTTSLVSGFLGPSTSTASTRSKHTHTKRHGGVHGQHLYGDDFQLRMYQRSEEEGYVW
jgi:hypothetical protein